MLYRIPATRKIERRGQCSRCVALSSTNNVESSPTKPKVNCTCLERQIQPIGNHLSPFSLNFLLYTQPLHPPIISKFLIFPSVLATCLDVAISVLMQASKLRIAYLALLAYTFFPYQHPLFAPVISSVVPACI
jgi:hypothetical protein